MRKFLILFIILFFITLTPSLANSQEYLTLAYGIGYIHESPTSPQIVYQANSSDIVKQQLKNGDWYKVTCNNDITGWIHSTFIKTDLDQRASTIVNLAHTRIGCRYEHAKAGPTIFDCSGLIRWLVERYTIYPNLKIDLSNGPEGQINDFTYAISVSDALANRNNLDSVLKPGDAIFFKWTTEKDADHVALYVGNNYIIHAKSAQYGVVKEKISDGYMSQICGIRRIFENNNIYIDSSRLVYGN